MHNLQIISPIRRLSFYPIDDLFGSADAFMFKSQLSILVFVAFAFEILVINYLPGPMS